MNNKTEEDILKELEVLVTSEGYIHALAYLVYRDYKVVISKELESDNLGPLYSRNRLIRTEISTLIGFMIKREINFLLPCPSVTQIYIDETERLLEDLHQSMVSHFKIDYENIANKLDVKDFLSKPEVLREAFFYATESAYHFQYRDFSKIKYEKDEKWLLRNKKFSTCDVISLFDTIVEIQTYKLNDLMGRRHKVALENLTLLEPFEFTIEDVYRKTKLKVEIVESILSEFSVSALDKNNKLFFHLNDFNEYNSRPLIKRGDRYISFLLASNWESLYESPFFWMMQDKKYKAISLKNRGDFTENISTELLGKVFGYTNVHKNILIKNKKNESLGEIDVLVEYAGRLFILQAKSKKLTLLARAGNEKRIKDDFRKSVQDSYDQGKSCAELIQRKDIVLKNSDTSELKLRFDIAEIFILCVVSDHYPALSSQVEHFLKYEKNEVINAPYILDIFTLDTIVEFLDNPLLFIDFIKKRVTVNSKVSAMHESVVLAYYLRQNLYVEDDISRVALDDTLATDLNVAMIVRRESKPGKGTPEGILTRYQGTNLWRVLEDLGRKESESSVEFFELVFSLNEETFYKLNSFIERICSDSMQDGRNHNASMTFVGIDQGITIHSSFKNEVEARIELLNHCEKRKYVDRIMNWMGVHFNPLTQNVNFILKLSSPWVANQAMNVITREMSSSKSYQSHSESDLGIQNNSKNKVGRNSLCPCGSGKKYKRCCLL